MFFQGAEAAVSVGEETDSACDYDDLQTALDSGANEIRLSREAPFVGAFIIASNDVALIGGYENCSAAAADNNDGLSYSVLQPNMGAVSILNISQVNEVILQQLLIEQAIDAPAISVSQISGSLQITNSEITNNTGTSGGALHMSDDSVVVLQDSHVHHNTVTGKGGAFYCENSNLTITQNNLINNNESTGSAFGEGLGGAIYAETCVLNIRAGHFDGVSAGLIENHAADDGGAIAAEDSIITIDGQFAGETAHPVVFKDNVSDSDNSSNGGGGAIYMHRGEAYLQSIWMNGNLGSPNGVGQFNRGAAIHTSRGAEVIISQDESLPCWRDTLCNLIENSNHVVFHIQRPSTYFTMTHAEIRNNDAPYTGIVWIQNSCCIDAGDGPFVTLENNLFHHNTSANAPLLKTDVSNDGCCRIFLNMQHNTITDNVVDGPVLDINLEVTMNFTNNILHNNDVGTWPFDIIDDSSVDTTIACILVDDDSSVPAHATQVIVADPMFVNPMAYDYHLTSASPAIDVCAQSVDSIQTADLDLELRGNDIPAIDNQTGSYDIGADEYYLPDLIFVQGFESM